jgi:hypothetical protein
VGGTWTVPTVSGKINAYSAVWVGIDGYKSNSVEQIGTEQDTSANGSTAYSAWYEMYPSASVLITETNGGTAFTISPGDTMNAEVSYLGSNQFFLQITDVTKNEVFSITKSAAGVKRSAAEWIVEAPSSGGKVLALANFGTVSFTQACATFGTTTATSGPIDDAAWSAIAINMASQGQQEDSTGTLADSPTLGFNEPSAGVSSSAFSVTFISTVPGKGNGSFSRVHTNELAAIGSAVVAPFSGLDNSAQITTIQPLAGTCRCPAQR